MNKISICFLGNLWLKILIIISFALLVTSCHNSKDQLHKKLSAEDSENNHYQGYYKIGSHYKIKNQLYKPLARRVYNQVGMASWYGAKQGFHGKKTANGDKYNKNALTAAHPDLPLPSLVKVTNLKNNKALIVMVNDRGPFSKKRIIDVSERAAILLGFKNDGIAKVRVQYLHKETQRFIEDLKLDKKEGSRAKTKLTKNKCSVNCHIKLVNLKHKLAIGG